MPARTLVVEGQQHPHQQFEDPFVGDVVGGNRVHDFDDGVAGVDAVVGLSQRRECSRCATWRAT
jgi:hypothetical protein